MYLLCFHLSTQDWIAIGMLITTIAILWVAWSQLSQIKKDKRVEFTYKVYMDFFAFINEERNKDLKEWLFGRDKAAIAEKDYDRLGDLFEKFESVNTLLMCNSLDENVFYNLISYYIEKAFVAKKPTADEFIASVRKHETKKIGGDTSDIFQGSEELYKKVMKMRKENER
jgi:hypothetical protein